MKKALIGGVLAVSMLFPVLASAQEIRIQEVPVQPAVEHITVETVHAFTPEQISAVIDLLRAFEVDQPTIDVVYQILVDA